MSQVNVATFSDVQALTTFLSIEGFLLATVSLAVTLGAPGRRRPAALPLPAHHIAYGAAGLSVFVGTGGVAAWLGLYGQGTLLPLQQLWIAIVILVAVLAQPVLAVLLSMGSRAKD